MARGATVRGVTVDPVTLFAILGPLLVEGGKAAISRWIAPKDFKPSSIADYSEMRRLELELFKAMNEAGGNNPSYLWVEAVVRLMRPGVAIAVIGTWAAVHLSGAGDASAIDNFAGAVGFYLFGDRTLFYARRAGVGER